ncbi:hypothetical protein V2J09_000187 [Rumex salicifolius]
MSVFGYKYYLVIIDDFSHYIWCFSLKYKSDTAAYLKQFHAYVQTQFPLKLKSIQCDHGREFDNNDLHSFSNHGVLLRFSCPHTSQQNGKAERMIRTITNTIRTLLFHGHLPPRFWVEALNTATYLLNITPTTTLAMRTPHQLLFNQLPSYGHLRVFGCLCYPNLTATTKHKLEPRTRPCVFLGYALQHRGYRCLDLANHKVIISRHVIFDESVFPFTNADPGAFPTPSPSTDDTIPLIAADPTNFSQPVVPSITATPAPAPSAPQIPQPAAPNPPPLLTYSRRARPAPPAPVLTYSRRPALPRPPPLTRQPHSMTTRTQSGAVFMSSNPVQHQRTKHIKIDIHFVREKVALGEAKVLHVPTSRQFADIFTKGLPSPLFSEFRDSLCLRPPPTSTAGGVSIYYYYIILIRVFLSCTQCIYIPYQ